MKSIFRFTNVGLHRLRAKYQAKVPIPGQKIWFVSGSVIDGNFTGLYQASLNIIAGHQGLMFANSFLLPSFFVTRMLVPWTSMSVQNLQAEWFAFVVDGVEVKLLGKKVAEAVRSNLLQCELVE